MDAPASRCIEMTRPWYETKGDLARERLFAKKIIGQRETVHLFKLPIKFIVDYAIVQDGAVIAWMEMRHRTTRKAKYYDYQTSAAKLSAGVILGEMYTLPFYLFVRFKDTDSWMEIDRNYLDGRRLEMMYLTSRNDPQDIEPCVSIPLTDLKDF